MFTNTQNWEPARRAKVVSILATLMGAAATIWSTLYTGCLGGHVEQSHVTAAEGRTTSSRDMAIAHMTYGSSDMAIVPPSLGGLAISAALPEAYSHYDYVLPSGSAGGGEGSTDGRYSCRGGWVNGDVASFFGLLAVVPPAITLFGAWVSFRMENDEQRRYADVQDGGDAVITRRLSQGVKALLAVLFAVGLSSMLAVLFDGDTGAVHVNQWAPVLMLGCLGVLVMVLGGEQDLAERCRGRQAADRDALALLLGKSSSTAGAGVLQRSQAVPVTVHTPRTALFTIEFWLIFCVMGTVCGSNSATMVRVLVHMAQVGSVYTTVPACLIACMLHRT